MEKTQMQKHGIKAVLAALALLALSALPARAQFVVGPAPATETASGCEALAKAYEAGEMVQQRSQRWINCRYDEGFMSVSKEPQDSLLRQTKIAGIIRIPHMRTIAVLAGHFQRYKNGEDPTAEPVLRTWAAQEGYHTIIFALGEGTGEVFVRHGTKWSALNPPMCGGNMALFAGVAGCD